NPDGIADLQTRGTGDSDSVSRRGRLPRPGRREFVHFGHPWAFLHPVTREFQVTGAVFGYRVRVFRRQYNVGVFLDSRPLDTQSGCVIRPTGKTYGFRPRVRNTEHKLAGVSVKRPSKVTCVNSVGN